jgi:hypothetical protein
VPWITNKIKGFINTRDKLKRKAIITKLETDWLNYKRTINQVNIALRNAKKNYYSTKIAGQKCNPKKAWKSINNLLGKQTTHPEVNELKAFQRGLITISQISDIIWQVKLIPQIVILRRM